MPTSVGSSLAGTNVEPLQPGKANDERCQSLGASWSCCPMEHNAKRLHFSIAKWPSQSARGRETPCWSPGRGSSPSGGAFVRLEPCEGRLSRTVLRRVRAGAARAYPTVEAGAQKGKFSNLSRNSRHEPALILWSGVPCPEVPCRLPLDGARGECFSGGTCYVDNSGSIGRTCWSCWRRGFLRQACAFWRLHCWKAVTTCRCGNPFGNSWRMRYERDASRFGTRTLAWVAHFWVTGKLQFSTCPFN